METARPLDNDEVGFSSDEDPDAVYHQALTKLRMLLSAAEAASSQRSSDEEFVEVEQGGSQKRLLGRSTEDLYSTQIISRPEKRGRFTKNPNAGTAKRNITRGQRNSGNRTRYNSWHNLEYLGSQEEEELLLIKKQENYIAQLEKEMEFCREQLKNVFGQVKGLLGEKGQQMPVNESLAQILEGHLKTTKPTVPFGGLNSSGKLDRENHLLNDAIKKLRSDVDEISKREVEAVEQVKRSVQVGEQLRMEKTELEYEITQLNLQNERQQSRIRSLIEEQVDKINEERKSVEKRSQEHVKSLREDASKQAEELGKTVTELERQKRVEMELRRQIADRDKILDTIRQDAEQRAGQLQLEMVGLKASKQQLEQDLGGLRVELEHSEHELAAERSRSGAELKSIRARLSKAEDMLISSRKESLELAESKANLERELNMTRMYKDGSVDSLNNETNGVNNNRSSMDKEHTVRKLHDLIRRQSQIIGELKHHVYLVTDRYSQDLSELQQSNEKLRVREEKSAMRFTEISARTGESGKLQERLCKRLEETDIEMRKALLQSESLQQEKKSLEHEISLLKDILKARGLLPRERRDHAAPKNRSKSTTMAAIKSNAMLIG